MSRLESAIRRLQAQRDCLNMAAAMVSGRDGPVLELGLGNGRTFDHLRALMPGRAIFVFDRQVAAHPDSTPEPAFVVLGDFRETLAAATPEQFGGPAVLAHCDIGSGDRTATAALAAAITPLLLPLLGPGAVIVADQPLAATALRPLTLPSSVAPGRYFMYRREPG